MYPAMDPYIPLLPENFLVSYSDVLPGLRRFNSAGLLSTTAKSAISTLASPMLCPTYSVMLRRLQLALPSRIHDLLMGMDARGGMASALSPAVRCGPAQCLSIRSDGRTAIGSVARGVVCVWWSP